MPKLNEKEVETYINEKYVANSFSEKNIFTSDSIKKIYRLSNGIMDRIDILCLQYLKDPVDDKEKNQSKKSYGIISSLIKYKLYYLLASIFLLFYIIALFEKDTENTKQIFSIKLPEKTDDKLRFDENLLIAMKEVSDPLMKQNDDHIHNNNIIDESNANKVMSLDAVTPLQEKKDDETIDTSDSPNISTDNKNNAETNENYKKNIGWLIGQEPDKYVLQLVSAVKQETILNYLAFFENNHDEIIEFTAHINGQKHYILVYGLFDNSELARAEIAKLPQKARQIKPWARTIKSIKELVK